jgi:hypothetical protein
MLAVTQSSGIDIDQAFQLTERAQDALWAPWEGNTRKMTVNVATLPKLIGLLQEAEAKARVEGLI